MSACMCFAKWLRHIHLYDVHLCGSPTLLEIRSDADKSEPDLYSGTYSSVGRRIGSDSCGLGFQSQTVRFRGKSITSLWSDNRPAIKGIRPP